MSLKDDTLLRASRKRTDPTDDSCPQHQLTAARDGRDSVCRATLEGGARTPYHVPMPVQKETGMTAIELSVGVLVVAVPGLALMSFAVPGAVMLIPVALPLIATLMLVG